MDDLYRVLDMEPDAPQEQLEKEYKALVRRYHPDGHPAARRAWAEERMKQINAAWAVLGDVRKRAVYDGQRVRSPAEASAPGSETRSPDPDVAWSRPDECAGHPGRTRVSVCLNCRQNVCEECLTTARGLPYCPRCAPAGPAPRVWSRGRARRRMVRTEDGDWVVLLAASAIVGVFVAGPYLYAGIGLACIRYPASYGLCGIASALLGTLCIYALLATWGRGLGLWLSRASRPGIVALFAVMLLLESGGVLLLTLAFPVFAKNVAAQAQTDRYERDGEIAAKALAAFYGCWQPRKHPLDQIRDRLPYVQEDDQPEPKNAGTARFEELAGNARHPAYEHAEAFTKTQKSREPAYRADRATCLAYLVWYRRETGQGPSRRGEASECLDLTTRADLKQLCLTYLAPADPRAAAKGENAAPEKPKAGEPPPPPPP